MGFFRVLIYGIILSVYTAALIYDVRFMPRVGSKWWIYKLVMLTMINLVIFIVITNCCFFARSYSGLGFSISNHHLSSTTLNIIRVFVLQTLQTVYSAICFLCTLFDWNEELVHNKEIKHAHVPRFHHITYIL